MGFYFGIVFLFLLGFLVGVVLELYMFVLYVLKSWVYFVEDVLIEVEFLMLDLSECGGSVLV